MAAPVNSGQVSETVAFVERELAKLWAAPDGASGAEVGLKVRASTMNLVVACAPAELERLRAETDDLAQTHAGRVFLATLEGRVPPWGLDATVSAVCRTEGGAPICSDRVELVFGASAATRASSVTSALALAEVPVVIESAAGAPAPLVDDLVKRCDRVVVDSAVVSPARIAEIARATKVPIADRAWVRTFTWRDLVARFFDQEPPLARSIRRVECVRAPGGKSEPGALLFGWLGSRLGWTFESRTRALDASGRPIELALAEDARGDVGRGEIVAIRMRAELEGQPLELAVARTEAPRTIRWSTAGARNEEHVHPMGFRDETWVLIKALDDRTSDAVYRAAALAAADWIAR